jgi:hypothetical protein
MSDKEYILNTDNMDLVSTPILLKIYERYKDTPPEKTYMYLYVTKVRLELLIRNVVPCDNEEDLAAIASYTRKRLGLPENAPVQDVFRAALKLAKEAVATVKRE